MTEPRDYVAPRIDEARLERVWSGISGGLERRSQRGWRWLVLSGALAAVGAGAVWLASASSEAPHRLALARGLLEARAEPLARSLSDGSALELAPQSSLAVRSDQPTSVALALGRGRVDLDVTHREGRQFTVVAGDVEVRVVGTQFSVTSSEGAAPRVEVSVTRGAVEVRSARRPGLVARVAAGQRWLQAADAREASRASDAPQLAAPSVSAPPEPASAPATPPKTESAAASAGAPSAGPSARELFERAGESRRAGDAAGAARAYEALLKLHPSDARAGLSAFELGRLRMDRLGDSAGAISALERAVASSLGPSFREDALARLVSVYAAQGNFAACGRARERYLSSYPSGVHAAAVASRCGAR